MTEIDDSDKLAGSATFDSSHTRQFFMQYRRFGSLPAPVSALGFGAMRLPLKGDDVDQAAAIDLLRSAIDGGVNYIDTAYPYHNGQSEIVVGKALADGYRDRALLATKLPIWRVESLDDCQRIFDEQLSRLQTDCVDFYLLHCLQEKSWPKMQSMGALQWLEGLQTQGRIKHIGFSFHDNEQVFRKIVDAYDWDFCQIQYNLVCEDVQAGKAGLEYAASKDLAVIAMEPLFGGALANPPQAVQEIWDRADAKIRPADVALRWLWNRPEVSLVLSGMSTMSQLEQNMASASHHGRPWLSQREAELVAQAQAAYRELSPIACTKCGYCLPCPHGVNIPLNFDLSNQAKVYQGNPITLCRNLYHGLPENQRAAACESCGRCEELCPQNLEISSLLGQVAKQFA